MTGDLFGYVPPAPTLVRLDRCIDHEQGCCSNIARIGPGKGQHAAELRCAGCDRHRGWLPKSALDFLTTISSRFGAPAEPIVLRDSTIQHGDETVATKQKEYDNTNRGVLFKNNDKEKDTDRDYGGTLDVDGTEFWISGWIKKSAKGTSYMALSIKPKSELAQSRAKPKQGAADELNDEIPF